VQLSAPPPPLPFLAPLPNALVAPCSREPPFAYGGLKRCAPVACATRRMFVEVGAKGGNSVGGTVWVRVSGDLCVTVRALAAAGPGAPLPRRSASLLCASRRRLWLACLLMVGLSAGWVARGRCRVAPEGAWKVCCWCFGAGRSCGWQLCGRCARWACASSNASLWKGRGLHCSEPCPQELTPLKSA